MNVLDNAASVLDQAAKELRGMGERLLLPAQEYSIEEALLKLRAALGAERSLSLDPPTVWLHGNSRKPDVGKWRVWDGATSYEAKTLAGAVNACLAAHAEAPSEPLADVERKLAAITAESATAAY